VLGFNYRVTDFEGAVGLVQLRKLDRFIDERARGAAYYRCELSQLSWLRLPGLYFSVVNSWLRERRSAPVSRSLKILDAIDRGEGPTFFGDGGEVFDFVAVQSARQSLRHARRCGRPVLQRRHRQAHFAQYP
jgi:hypothetical protein